MAAISHRCFKIITVPKHSLLPIAHDTMEVSHSDIIVQKEAFETVLLCSNGPRRRPPALPPEEDSSLQTESARKSPITGYWVLDTGYWILDTDIDIDISYLHLLYLFIP